MTAGITVRIETNKKAGCTVRVHIQYPVRVL